MPEKISFITHNLGSLLTQDIRGLADRYEKFSPDIITLNEVQKNNFSGRWLNQAEELAALLGMSFVFFVPAFDRRSYPGHPSFKNLAPGQRAQQGNAVLSRFPFVDRRIIPLYSPEGPISDRRTEPRQALSCRVRISGGRKIRVVATHLSNIKMEWASLPKQKQGQKIRLKQVSLLLEALSPLKGTVILAGDFNCTPETKEIQVIKSTGFFDASESLFNTRPRYDEKGDLITAQKLDYIFLPENTGPCTASMIPVAGLRGQSDHNALNVKLDF